MKVLMTADAVGGVWTYSLELARALAAHDVQVVLATMGALPSREQRREAEAVDGLALYASDYALEWMREPWDDVRRADAWLRELASAEAVDLVHLNGYAHASPRWPVPVVVVAHSCVASWWKAVKRSPLPDEWAPYVARVREGVHAADAVVAPTAAMLASVGEHYGAPERAFVIPNGRDASGLVPRSKERVIVSVGRLWDEAKNVAALAAAARTLPWPVRVAGSVDGPAGSAATLANVEVLGQLDAAAVADALGRAAIYALPARYEPFGLSVLEAALCGCALVLGDLESLRESWGDAAVYVASDDSAALAVALRALCDDGTRRRAMAQRARARASAFTPATMGERYAALYAMLRAERAARAERTTRIADREVACAS